MKKKIDWASFPERYPWLPAIISIIALIAAYTKVYMGKQQEGEARKDEYLRSI